MSNLAININSSAQATLTRIKNALNKNEVIIPINTNFYFTKGQPGKTSGYIFHEKSLEKEVTRWLQTRTSFNAIMSRYKKYDPNLISLKWPKHYATRFINVTGKAAEGENIFMFFPDVLGLPANTVDDYFGFEFIDIWSSIFDEIIFPCVRRIFDEDSQLKLYTKLRPMLEKTIYLASVFHEIGHRCGYWKVSPNTDSRITINKFNMDVLGELSTDTLLVNFLHEFPEVVYFIFLQRLFWFGRFGFKNNPISGKLNEDNDTWIGSYLWNKYIQHGAITKTLDNRLHINYDTLLTSFIEIMKDTDYLGQQVVLHADQNGIITNWMRQQVEYQDDTFIFPKELRSVFLKCVNVAEKPLCKY
ncbi:MAG: hypothetical protein A3F46_10710 [Legionellales bacterium RIFCSPHIGHO2_12_FULL_42_9]|nr:MAG: hypothetical protein A3F46_10710 [Legionellales bacterium RIFCSPHIGHO2_12_FULL_42_9]